MKKLFTTSKHKTLAIILAIVVIASVAGGTGAFASTVLQTRQTTAQFTVIPLYSNMALFADEAATTPLSTVVNNLGGAFHAGATTPTRTFYMKNTGEVPFSGVTVTSNLVASAGTTNITVTYPNEGDTIVPVGGVVKVEYYVSISTTQPTVVTTSGLTLTVNALGS